MIKRVEVVTGGASAAYGTDAVAGVTNFILDTDYTGVKGHVQGGETTRGDGGNKEASLAWGTAIGSRVHLIASVDYYDAKAIESYDGRNWMQNWGTVLNPAWSPGSSQPQYLVKPNVDQHAVHVRRPDQLAGHAAEQPEVPERWIGRAVRAGQHRELQLHVRCVRRPAAWATTSKRDRRVRCGSDPERAALQRLRAPEVLAERRRGKRSVS